MRHVIVGNGVADVTAAQAIRQASPFAEVSVIGGEPYPYYRRPLLWKFIAGQIGQEAIVFRPDGTRNVASGCAWVSESPH